MQKKTRTRTTGASQDEGAGALMCGAVLRLSRIDFSFCFSSLLNILFRHLLPSPSFFFSSFFLLSKGGEKEHGFV